jgi:serine phosphatase RsbU (regulator of sigma subunit)
MTPKILTIDDERMMRQIIAAYLEDSGFQVIQAENGRVGIEACRQEQPDLILCDLRMPEIDGLEVLATVTREFPEIPILVVSGMGRLSDAIEALKLGAWDYLTKPIEDMAVLEHAIRQALERARLRRENREHREHLEAINKKLAQSLRQLEEDESAARRIQFQLLPSDNQVHGPYRFSRGLFPSLYLSGDFVDYFAIDSDYLGFYMADVSGHGVSSAFVTVLLRSYMDKYLEAYLQGQEKTILEPAQTLKRLNQDIHNGRLDKYLTIFYGVIDRSANLLSFSNGGQFPFPILYDGTDSRYVESKSLPVGLFDFAEYRTDTLKLPENFVMALYSDGILETLPQSSLLGKQSYLLSLATDMNIDVHTLVQKLGLEHSISLPDDITLLLIKRQN